MLSLFGLIIFGLFALKGDVWHANWTNAWDLHGLDKSGNATVAAYTMSAAFGAVLASSSARVGSIMVTAYRVKGLAYPKVLDTTGMPNPNLSLTTSDATSLARKTYCYSHFTTWWSA